MSDSPIDVFILARPDHPQWLAATVESARKMISPSPHRIVVVGQDANAEIDWRRVMGFAPADLPVLKSLPAESREACFRQFLKWGLSQVAGTDLYMCIDAGSVFTRPCTVLDGSRSILGRERLFHFPDCRMHNWLFGMYPPVGGWFVPPAIVYDKTIVAEMIRLIESRYKIRWYDAALNILNGVPHTRFCAAQAYGGYAQTFHPGKIAFRPSNHARLPPELFEKQPENQADIVTFGSDDPQPLGRPVLRMSSLGINGRFGNQIFQYAFLRLLAAQKNMEPQCPAWVGNSLFGCKENWAADPLPLWSDQDGSLNGQAESSEPAPSGAELWGYFQFHTSFYRRHQKAFRELFQPIPAFAGPLDQAVQRLTGDDGTLIGIHLRRGDFSNKDFWPAPTEWYIRWLEETWPTLHKPVLFVASDEPAKVVGDFSQFAPKTAADLGVNLKGAEYYPDFFTLTRCRYLAISNSTFSYAAAMLNATAGARFVRPEPDLHRLVSFDPWDSSVLLAPKLAA